MKRRSFFQSLAKAAAIIALAPQLAFRVKPEIPKAPKELVAFWCQTKRHSRTYDDAYVKALEDALAKMPLPDWSRIKDMPLAVESKW